MVEVSFDIPFKRHVQLQMAAASPEIFSEWREIHGVKNVKGRERMDIALCHMWLPEHRQIVATALLEYYRRRPLSRWLRHIDSNWSWAYSTCFLLEVFDLYKKRKGPPLRFDEDPNLAAERLLKWLQHNNERPYVQDINPYGQFVVANWVSLGDFRVTLSVLNHLNVLLQAVRVTEEAPWKVRERETGSLKLITVLGPHNFIQAHIVEER